MRLYFLILCLLLTLPTLAQRETVCAGGAPPSRLEQGDRARIIAEGGSNLRSLPASGSDLLNVIPTGDLIPILDGPFCAGGYAWYQTEFMGQRGWLAEGVGEFYWLEPYRTVSAQIGTIRAEVFPELASGIRANRRDDEVIFILEGDFDEQLPPTLSILPPDTDPDLPETLAGELAQSATLELQQGEVSRYLTLRINGLDTNNETRLDYVVVGELDDGRVVRGIVPVQLPELILQVDSQLINRDEDYRADYLASLTEQLNTAPPDNFAPSLTLLDLFVQSLNVDAPADRSDTILYEYNNLSFNYHPSIADDFVTELISEEGTPRHLRVQALGYPIDNVDAEIRIFRTSDVDSTWLARLQLLLSQQPTDPPRIPILLRQDDDEFSNRDVLYGRFGSGGGVRAIVSYEDSAFYTYQGLTEDREFYISVMMPVQLSNGEVIEPELLFLDDLVASLTITMP